MRDEFRIPLCDPCKGLLPDGSRGLPRHDECEGGAVTCECWTEVLMEAEETP